MLRHFPHQAEALEGMAGGAGVPRAWLAHCLAREPAADSLAVGGEGVGAGDPGKRLLARSVAGDVIVRRIRPDGGFGSLELVRPWLTSGLAGVNEEGLALLCAQVGDAPGDCAAPAILLARDCLQHFDTVAAALEWCTGRPAGGRATLLLTDASGELIAVEVAGSARRVRRADGGLLVAAPPERSAAIEKSLRVTPSGSAGALIQSLAAGTEVDACVLVDPDQRRLGLAAPGAQPTWFPVRAPH
jgi:hypothetical protein